MATDQEISQALQTLLRESSPKTTFSDVIQQLQSKLGVDLTHKLDFIRSQIQLLFQPQPHPPPPQHHILSQKDHFALHPGPNYHPSPSAFHSFPPQPAPPQPAKLDGQPAHFVSVALPEPAKESVQAKGKRKGGAGGLNKLCSVSPELQVIVGQPALPRTEIVKQLWAYIRKNNLQDPNNKRKIICNEELRVVFETDCTDMFKMNKLLAKHITPLEPTKVSQSKKLKVDADPGVRSPEIAPSVKISEALANFFGVNDREMLQSEITRRIWEYINVNHLQDPQNSMVIHCDAKLQAIFGCESIAALGIPEVLARLHLIRR